MCLLKNNGVYDLGLKKWVFRPSDKALAKEIAEECAIDPVVAMLAVARGYTDPWLIEELLSDDLLLNDPYALTDISIAADRVRQAIQDKEKILIFGDYDCDGVTATVLLYEYLTKRQAEVAYAIPRRDMDGYGLNSSVVETYAAEGVSLIITVDNGISALQAIDEANRQGVDVIVTDHHLPQGELPDAYAVVDPHRADDGSEFKSISGVCVAFKLVCAIEGASPEEMLPHFADLVTIGTVADVMPLLNENRSMVKFGLQQIAAAPRPGLRALLDVCGLRDKPITASSVAFALAPRINAAGRMCDADLAARLLLSNHLNTAYTLARELNDYNFQRQETEQEIVRDACRRIAEENLTQNAVLVIAGLGWHCGVVGIAAARIAEQYGKPCLLFSIEGDTATGSGRSIAGFDLFAALKSTSALFVRFGGHAQAVGATIRTEDLDALRTALNQYAVALQPVYPELIVDCKLNPAALTVDFVQALSALEPFGTGNSTPLFALTDMQITRIDMVGKEKQHMRLTVTKGQTALHAIAFSARAADFGIAVGCRVDLAVTLSVQPYNGRDTLNIVVRDIRLAGRDEDAFYRSVSNYRAFLRSACETDYTALYPSRDAFVSVFRMVQKYGEISLGGLQNYFSSAMLPDKIAVIADCLEELGIFAFTTVGAETYIRYLDNGKKVNLEESEILHIISERRSVS